MRTVNESNITETFLSYFGPDTDPRLREVMTALSQHLHDFAKETKLTHEEWQAGVKFMQWAGDITTDDRNEFILLSDVMGLSSLVDMINSSEDGTSSSVLGPFHISGSPDYEMGADLRKDTPGELVLVQGRILDPDLQPIAGATLDIWQTAPNGLYSSQDEQQDRYNFHALFKTDTDGYYTFTTTRPVSYTVPTDGPVGGILNATGRHPWRPSHLHYIVEAEGYQPLVTEVFPDDDPYLDEDTVFGVRSDLVMTYHRHAANTFPDSGYELSGKVTEDYLRVDFDVVLSRA